MDTIQLIAEISVLKKKMDNAEAFFEELVEYLLVTCKDDDYITPEVICRKLAKYGYIELEDGYWVNPLADRKTEPTHDLRTETHECVKPNADQQVQRIEYVESDEKSRCRKCKHFKREYETPVSSDGRYYTYITCSATKCVYEPKDEPQYDAEEVAKDINRRVDLIKREWEVRNTETNVETMSCQECKHWDDMRNCWIMKSYGDCKYEPKTEPQTERSE